MTRPSPNTVRSRVLAAMSTDRAHPSTPAALAALLGIGTTHCNAEMGYWAQRGLAQRVGIGQYVRLSGDAPLPTPRAADHAFTKSITITGAEWKASIERDERAQLAARAERRPSTSVSPRRCATCHQWAKADTDGLCTMCRATFEAAPIVGLATVTASIELTRSVRDFEGNAAP